MCKTIQAYHLNKLYIERTSDRLGAAPTFNDFQTFNKCNDYFCKEMHLKCILILVVTLTPRSLKFMFGSQRYQHQNGAPFLDKI